MKKTKSRGDWIVLGYVLNINKYPMFFRFVFRLTYCVISLLDSIFHESDTKVYLNKFFPFQVFAFIGFTELYIS